MSDTPSPDVDPSTSSASQPPDSVAPSPLSSPSAAVSSPPVPPPPPPGIPIPPEFVKQGSDWLAIYNPAIKRVLDVTLLQNLKHESVVCCVRFSNDGKFLATGCDRTAQIYDTETGAKVCVLADESVDHTVNMYIRSVCFSPDGKYLATAAEDNIIRIWDIAKQRLRNVFDGHQMEIYSLDFSQDGTMLVSGSGDKTVRIWSMIDGTTKVLAMNDQDSLNNDPGVTSVAISPDGRYVAAGSLDAIARIWEISSGQLVERLCGHYDGVYSVAFTPDGKGFISGSLDRTLKYWDISALGTAPVSVSKDVQDVGPEERTGSRCTMTAGGHEHFVLSVAVSHDSAWVVSASKDRTVIFWDRTGLPHCRLHGHQNAILTNALSPAGSLLATGSGDFQAKIWRYGPVGTV